jgi:hypothetical protein
MAVCALDSLQLNLRVSSAECLIRLMSPIGWVSALSAFHRFGHAVCASGWALHAGDMNYEFRVHKAHCATQRGSHSLIIIIMVKVRTLRTCTTVYTSHSLIKKLSLGDAS